MKQIRKSTAAAISLTLLASLSLAACGSNSGGSKENGSSAATPKDSAQPTAQATAKAELKDYTVTLYYPGTPQKDEAKVEEKINEYLKGKINAKLDLMSIDWGSWDNKMNLMMASGEKADIIFTASWNGHTVNVAKGAFLPLNDLLKSNGQDILKNLDPAFLEGAAINGKNYGVPTNKELAATRGVLVRQDLLKKHNLNISGVKTWADLEPLLKTIKEKEPDVVPFYVSNDNGLMHSLDWDSLGDGTVPGVLFKTKKDTKVLNELETPEYKHAAELTRKWYTAGYINKDAATTTVKAQELMKAGKLFMYTSALKPGADKEVSAAVGKELVQIDLTVPTITTGDASGAMLGIAKNSQDPARAMMVINLLHSDKVLNNLVVYGIEGTHYVKASDNVIKFPQGVDAATSPYYPGSGWQMGSQFLNYLRDNEDPQKWDLFKAFNSKGVKSPALGFAFNPEPVKSEIAAIANISKEYTQVIASGAVDPNEVIPKYLDKLKKSGVDKVIAEKQKQLDAWLAANKK